MKIQLDYDKKEIVLIESTNIGEFTKKIKNILPDWKEWNLQTQVIYNNWQTPIVITEPYVQKPWWEYPPTVTHKTEITGTHCLIVN